MPGGRLCAGDEARGCLNLGKHIPHALDSRQMGLFGGELADRLRSAGVLQQDDFDATHAEPIDGGLHTDRRGEPADYRSIEVARLELGEKIAGYDCSKCGLAHENIAILHDTVIESGGGGVLRKRAGNIGNKVRHAARGTVLRCIECMDVDDCPTDPAPGLRGVNEVADSRVSMGYWFPAIAAEPDLNVHTDPSGRSPKPSMSMRLPYTGSQRWLLKLGAIMSFFRANQPVVLGPGEGTHLDVLGDLITLLISGNQTNGAFTVLSETSPPDGGTPLHTHHNEDEALYVLQGEYEIQCGEQTVRAGAGAFVFAPRDIPHKLTNVSSGPSTVLGIVSPAGFEGFWEEVSQLPPPPDIDQILAIAKKYRLEIHTP